VTTTAASKATVRRVAQEVRMGSVIEVDNVRKRYGPQVAVADVSFQVA
jgi:hypothetical protein